MEHPNFFIIGAPKCGTTALSEYLKGHFNIFMSTPKEPHYFATDMPKFRLTHNLDDYLNLFKDVNNNHMVIGEASVWYSYSEHAVKNIFEFNPNAKIVYMVRNPVDLVYSMHSQALASLDESIPDFSKAWSLSELRKKGGKIPLSCRDRKILYYDEIAKLGTQLERLLSFFPKKQLHIVFYDDFSVNTKRTYDQVLNFLELCSDKRDDFPVINKNEKLKSRMLLSILRKLPGPFVKTYTFLKNTFGFSGIRLINKLHNWNHIETKRNTLNVELKNKIIKHYKEDVIKLGLLTNRDLSHWLT